MNEGLIDRVRSARPKLCEDVMDSAMIGETICQSYVTSSSHYRKENVSRAQRTS